MILLAGSASRALARPVETQLGVPFGAATIERFPDGEVSVSLDGAVRGDDVILLAATAPPVNDHLVELLALADACRRADAGRVAAIVPYFGYARSDRRDGRRTPIMASLVADLMQRAGVDHVITVDVHAPAIEGFFRVPVDNLTAIPALAQELGAMLGEASPVIVAPDVGALRLANRYARLLDVPVAVCHKRRLSGTSVSIDGVTGDVAGKRCVIIDDMISTGATIAASAHALDAAGAIQGHVVAATHAVLVPGALERLAQAAVQTLLVTDSIEDAAPAGHPLAPRIVSIAPLIATAIRRLIDGGSLRQLA